MKTPMSRLIQDYFDYINERESIRLKRLNGDSPPWTDDPALQRYRFTNVHRSDDRTTKEFKEIYDEHWDSPHEEIILNAAIYRWIGTTLFARLVGWQTSYDPGRIIDIIRDRKSRGLTTFTGAYVISTLNQPIPKEEAVANIALMGFSKKIPEIADVARETRSYEKVHGVIYAIHGFGKRGFMAKEICMDLQMTPVLKDSEDIDTWTPTGPGAMRGLNWIHGRTPTKKIPHWKALDEIWELGELAPDHTDIPLNASDIQWNLCEFGKLCFIREGGRGRRRFKPSKET